MEIKVNNYYNLISCENFMSTEVFTYFTAKIFKNFVSVNYRNSS